MYGVREMLEEFCERSCNTHLNESNNESTLNQEQLKRLREKSCFEAYKAAGNQYLASEQYDKAETHFKAARKCDDCTEENLGEIERLIDRAIALRVENLESLLETANQFNYKSIGLINSLENKQDQYTEWIQVTEVTNQMQRQAIPCGYLSF